jgi:hypothetical protein
MSPRLIKRIGLSFLLLGLIFFVLEILFAYYIPGHSFIGAVIFNLGFFYQDFVTVLFATSIVFLISGFGTAFIGYSMGKKKTQPLIPKKVK